MTEHLWQLILAFVTGSGLSALAGMLAARYNAKVEGHKAHSADWATFSKALSERITELDALVERQGKQILELQERIATLQAELAATKIELEVTRRERDEMAEKAKLLEKRVAELEMEIIVLRRKLDEGAKGMVSC